MGLLLLPQPFEAVERPVFCFVRFTRGSAPQNTCAISFGADWLKIGTIGF
jgi:hypothetical protein